MSLNPKRTVAELKELRELTADENGAQRVAWTDVWQKARKWLATKLVGLPIEHHYDAAGNNWVTLRGVSDKTLLIGGHLDSVPNGGGGCRRLELVWGLRRVGGVPPGVKGEAPPPHSLGGWGQGEGG